MAGGVVGATLAAERCSVLAAEAAPRVTIAEPVEGEDLFAHLRRVKGDFDAASYKQLLGAANEFKEGDEMVGVAAADEASRLRARQLLANTRIDAVARHPLHDDQLHRLLQRHVDAAVAAEVGRLTFGELKRRLLTDGEPAIKQMMAGLSSDAIGCVVKLMSNAELILVGAKIFNPLPGSRIGAKGYLGARIQPNSPTDHVDDIRWQVFSGWSFAVGDVVLGTNPVSSDPQSVLAVERALQDLLATFGLEQVMPHCVLAHIDVQAEVEKLAPGSTALWFQSIAGSDTANATFDLTLDKMQRHAASRTGQYGLYFETGQGADFTNGHGHGFDMVLHESRKYGYARALTASVAAAQTSAGAAFEPWVHVNDVAGFIGPEVFRTREQLVRCCLEDIVMGKLHGLCIGLDVCSTLHMDVSLDDLDWCLDRVMPACPAYLMALPTKIDPMLGYLTTGFQDHVRLREKFGYRVNDPMWQFFQQLEVIDEQGRPTAHFGDPLWVFLQYCRRRGDRRSDAEILLQGERELAAVRQRGVFVARGHGAQPWDLEPALQRDVRRIYADAKESIWAELTAEFARGVPAVVELATRSEDRADYILHPESGEQLSETAAQRVDALRRQHAGKHNVQIVFSDGLNALAIMDDGHLAPFLETLRKGLAAEGYSVAPEHLLVTSGRVRAGYRIGERLFGGLRGKRALIHVIGERPGSGHHTFSAYITAPTGDVWGETGKVDHNITKVVSGIARTALAPVAGAAECVRILNTL
ncbi:MAG: ethanolamine ammonia-lyase subunit EutB [Planctomycetales bacterium]|nr:ethanolamine ammonia-lyase subunit EutB [Planctomycetales bacterium]